MPSSHSNAPAPSRDQLEHIVALLRADAVDAAIQAGLMDGWADACADALDGGVQPRRLRADDLTAPFRGMRAPASAACASPDSAYPLDDARTAHEDLHARRTTGKLVLIP